MTTIAEFRGSFRSVVSDGDRLRQRMKGTWFCRCGEPAVVERENPKCDTCAGGGFCGMDCTVSKIYCIKCGASV